MRWVKRGNGKPNGGGSEREREEYGKRKEGKDRRTGGPRGLRGGKERERERSVNFLKF